MNKDLLHQRFWWVVFLLFLSVEVMAQQLTFSHPHGFCTAPFSLEISMEEGVWEEGDIIHYTLDASEPTAASAIYSEPLPTSPQPPTSLWTMC